MQNLLRFPSSSETAERVIIFDADRRPDQEPARRSTLREVRRRTRVRARQSRAGDAARVQRRVRVSSETVDLLATRPPQGRKIVSSACVSARMQRKPPPPSGPAWRCARAGRTTRCWSYASTCRCGDEAPRASRARTTGQETDVLLAESHHVRRLLVPPRAHRPARHAARSLAACSSEIGSVKWTTLYGCGSASFRRAPVGG